MAEIPLALEFILEKLQEINFSQISQEDQNDYAHLILALDNNHYSRQQFKQELMEVFSKEGENEEEKSETKTKIDTLLQEIYKYKLNLHQTQIEQNKQKTEKKIIQEENKKVKSISKERKLRQPQNMKEIEGEKQKMNQFKKASEQAAASVKQKKEGRTNSQSQQKQNLIKSIERPQNQLKEQTQAKVIASNPQKQGILSRIKKHTEENASPIKKIKKEDIQTKPNQPYENVINSTNFTRKQIIAKQMQQPKQQFQEQEQNQQQQQQQQQLPSQQMQQMLPEMSNQFQQMQQFNQIYQMMLTTMQQSTKAKSKQKIRCKYWPNCKDGENCQYHHPTEKCKNFPNCPYGSQCLYIHPDIPCKFGTHCQRPNCSYSHKPQTIKQANVAKNAQDQEAESNQNQNTDSQK